MAQIKSNYLGERMFVTILVLLFAVMNTALLIYSLQILRGISAFKLNNQTYMYVPQDHLRRSEKTTKKAQ